MGIFKRSSLFWKIFFAFWLANVLAIAASSYFSFYARQHNDERENRREVAELIGRNIISQWENNGVLAIPGRLRREGIRIEDESGKLLFSSGKSNSRMQYYAFRVQSNSNRTYTLYLPQHRQPKKLRAQFKQFLELRLLLVFIASGIVSYILAQMITRPLKQLGEQTRALGSGALEHSIDPGLLGRKDEIGDLAREFDGALLNISALIDSKQTLLHDVSHELRAPLARLMAAIGLLQQAREKAGDAADTAMLDRIEAESRNMNELIDQILRLSRLESTRPDLQPVDVVALLQKCIEDTSFEFDDHPIALQADDDHIVLSADARLLETAFSNLLRNACQHTPGGTCIEVEVKKHTDALLISVLDYGDGVPEEQLEALFKPFTRLHDSGANAGLGLNITLRVIEKHRGSISAENIAGKGLCFRIELPLSSAP